MGSITSLKCVLTQEHLDAICAKYFVPEEVHPQLPSPDATMHERPAGKVGMYTRFFDYANYRIPFSTFFVSVLTHFRIPFSQLSVFGSAKVSYFEILCRVCNINPAWVSLQMDLNAFIRTADPRKLSASVEREFVGDASVAGGGNEGVASVGGQDNVEPIVPITDNVETEIPGPKRTKKKRVTRGSERTPAASHPPKRLRADYGTTGGSATRGAKSTDPEVDSLVRSVAPMMTTATIVTDFVSSVATTTPTAIDAGKDKDVPVPSIFTGSSSSDRTDRTLSLFTGRSCNEFAAGSIRAGGNADVNLQEVYVPEWSVTKGFERNDRRSCANMIDHFTPPAFFKTVRGMEHEQLFAEFNVSAACNLSLSSELLQAKVDSMEVAQLRTWVSSLEAIESSLRGELEAYEGGMKQLEEFQDSLMKPLEARVAELDADFTKCCISFQENFHPYLLNVIAGRRWLLTHGMRLLVAKCLNSFDYMEALRFALSHAIEKGMQDGLAASIEHGQAGRCLTDLEAYIPSAEDDFNFAPDVNQLMVPVHDKQKRVVIGSQALSMAMDVCRGRVEKMKKNLAECLPFLKDVFAPLIQPLSAEPLSAIPEKPAESLAATNALSTIA
ncbi:hypothetical protein Tco_1327786 [Tanacetum coccineum]